MSSTHKPKPPDRGAPAHKPSRKVALDEVLRSLQDLVQNELNVDAPVAAKPEAPAAPPDTSTEHAAPVLEPGTADTVALDLPAASLDAGAPPAPDTALPTAPAPLDSPSAPPGGLQQELPYLDTPAPTVLEPVANPPAPSPVPAIAASEPASDQPAPAAAADADAASAPVIDIAEPPRSADSTSAPAAPGLGEAVDFDDIPVLEDAVELSDDFPTLDALAADSSPQPTNPLILARDARRLAIQVAARLNVSLRREGKPGLSSEVITRLAHELEQALAKGDANRENTRPKKH